MPQQRKMPSKSAIYRYWKGRLLKQGIEIGDPNTCFACGNGSYIERAHIIAKCNGGIDDAKNLHLLCRGCHTKTELLSEKAYWTWLKKTNQEDYKLHFQHVYENLQKAGFNWDKFIETRKINGNIAATEYLCSFNVYNKEVKEKLTNNLLRLMEAEDKRENISNFLEENSKNKIKRNS